MPALPDGLARRLRERLGPERFLEDAASRLAYESDALAHFRVLPLAICLPRDTEDCVAIVRAAVEAGIPITPRGAGTGLSGGATPAREGSLVVDTSAMRRVLAIDLVDRYAVVEPGLVNARLGELVAKDGFFYAPDPSSQMVCTLGGNYAENSSGPHSLEYGSTAGHVLGATVVLDDGSVVELGGPEGPDELDLVGAFSGSEGTLGIVTSLTLRLTPRPTALATLLASFPSLPRACRAVSAIVAEGIECAAIEALDRRTIEAVENSVFAAGYPRDAEAVLLVEIDGHPGDVGADHERVREIFERGGMLAFDSAADPERRKLLWRGRKGAFGAMGRVAPNVYVMDAVVPRSHLETAIRRIGEICDRHELTLANVFHAGEGNLHPNISYDGRDEDEVARVLAANAEIVRVCLELGGTLSGEHGVGLEKREFMDWIFSESDLATFAAFRAAFAPSGLFNPDKLLPTPRACAEVKGPGAGIGGVALGGREERS
ncbi:MAG: FAD-linked oxidase C-terminal domain-containing protein [Planctomycetota bacterium]